MMPKAIIKQILKAREHLTALELDLTLSAHGILPADAPAFDPDAIREDISKLHALIAQYQRALGEEL